VCLLVCFKLAKLDENATQFDKIAAAAHQKFNTLAATVMESMVGRKVMAAIVMTSDQIGIDSGCVISLATGQFESFLSGQALLDGECGERQPTRVTR